MPPTIAQKPTPIGWSGVEPNSACRSSSDKIGLGCGVFCPARHPMTSGRWLTHNTNAPGRPVTVCPSPTAAVPTDPHGWCAPPALPSRTRARIPRPVNKTARGKPTTRSQNTSTTRAHREPTEKPKSLAHLPGVPHFPVWVTGSKQTLEALVASAVEPFLGHGQQASYPVERARFASSVSQCLVLYPTSHQVNAAVGKPHYMERVGHLTGMGQHLVVGDPVRARHVQHRPTNPARHSADCARNHPAALCAVLPGTMSNN